MFLVTRRSAVGSLSLDEATRRRRLTDLELDESALKHDKAGSRWQREINFSRAPFGALSASPQDGLEPQRLRFSQDGDLYLVTRFLAAEGEHQILQIVNFGFSKLDDHVSGTQPGKRSRAAV